MDERQVSNTTFANYRNGRDLTATSRGVMVIDLFGLSADAVRRDFPEVYQHLMADRSRLIGSSKPTKSADQGTAVKLIMRIGGFLESLEVSFGLRSWD